MSKKHFIGLIIALIFMVMVAAMVHEAFDVGDKTPLTTDPEFVLMTLGIMMVFCLGIAVITVCLAHRHLTHSKVLRELSPALAPDRFSRAQAFETERLLFSTPPTVTSLRV